MRTLIIQVILWKCIKSNCCNTVDNNLCFQDCQKLNINSCTRVCYGAEKLHFCTFSCASLQTLAPTTGTQTTGASTQGGSTSQVSSTSAPSRSTSSAPTTTQPSTGGSTSQASPTTGASRTDAMGDHTDKIEFRRKICIAITVFSIYYLVILIILAFEC